MSSPAAAGAALPAWADEGPLADLHAVWASRTFAAARRLGVFGELGKGPRTAAQLAHRLRLDPEAAPELLDALVALGWLERDGDDADAFYLATRSSTRHLDPRSPAFVGGLLDAARWPVTRDVDALVGALHATSATRATGAAGAVRGKPVSRPVTPAHPPREALRDGLAQLHGEALAQRLGHGEALAQRLGHGEALAQRLGHGAPGLLIDMAGPGATLACAWVGAAPATQALVLRSPADLPAARAQIDARGLGARVRATGASHAGRLAPQGATWVCLSLVWQRPAAHARQALLRRAARHLAAHGQVLVIDHLVDDSRTRSETLLWGLAARQAGARQGSLPVSRLLADCTAVGLDCIGQFSLPGGASALLARRAG